MANRAHRDHLDRQGSTVAMERTVSQALRGRLGVTGRTEILGALRARRGRKDFRGATVSTVRTEEMGRTARTGVTVATWPCTDTRLKSSATTTG